MPDIGELRIDQPIPKPRRRRRGPLSYVWLLLLIAAVGWYFRDRLPLAELANVRSGGQGREVAIYTVPSDAAGPRGSFSAGGYIEVLPPGPLRVSALVAGKLNELLVKPGDRVAAGQTIARLDSSLYRNSASVLSAHRDVAMAQLKLASAPTRRQEVDTRGAELSSAEARLRQAQSKHDRDKYLYEQGVIALQEYEVSLADLQSAEAAVTALTSQVELAVEGPRTESIAVAEAQLSAMNAQLGEIGWKIKQCEITAPMAGVVYEQIAHPGSWLNPDEGSPESSAVISIIDPAALQCWVDVNQRDIRSVSIGQSVKLEADALPDTALSGTVAYFMPQASLQKNTVRVIVAIADPPPTLLPEMSLKVTFLPVEMSAAELAALPTGVLVPATAVLDRDTSPSVFVVVDGKATRRSVTVGEVEGTELRVLSGIVGGEQLVQDPAGVREGQQVQAQGEDSSASE